MFTMSNFLRSLWDLMIGNICFKNNMDKINVVKYIDTRRRKTLKERLQNNDNFVFKMESRNWG
jgi:mannitol-1-phosphate/altronate dehydrogenase